ncbi:MAG TPA: glycosyltransferase [Anaerolineales bacterium]|nr:glycosyltransferase [Anaerolineales bacterium]
MKICILTIGTRGDVQPYIALGLGLKAVGHEVTIATLGEFESLVKEYGMQYASLRGDFLKAAQEAQSNSSNKQRTNPLQLIRQYTEMAKDTLRDEWESAKNTEIFIYNPAAIGAYDIAEKLAVPAFSAFPTPLYSPTKEFPSPFFPFRNLGPFNKLSHTFFAKMGPAIYRRPVNEWRRNVLGLPPAKGGEALRDKPVTKLYAYSEAVVPRPVDWDDSSVVTGYWFLDAPRTWQPEPALVKFLSAGPPPVYIGFGSMSMFGGANKSALVLEALELAGQRGVLAGIEVGTNSSSASKRVLHINAVPHDWLFPQMAAVVHHGGAGTTGASLRAGKPTVICPFVGDQTFWGNRVAVLGVGPAPIPKGKLTAEALARAIREAVADEGMHQRAASLGSIIRAEDGVGNAVALISSRL